METHTRRSVLIVIPVFAIVYARPFRNFLGMMLSAAHQLGDRYRFDVHVPERELLHDLMNRSARLMLTDDYDAMIVCDDDCLPPVDAIPRLLAHYENGKDIVCGLGYMRGYPHTTTAGRYYPEGISIVSNENTRKTELAGFQWLDDLPIKTGLHQVDFCGFPIGMVSRRAFEKIGEPWFGTIDEDGGACTHDVFFGNQARKKGVTIYVDTDMPCGHLTEGGIVTPESRAFVRRVRPLQEKFRIA